MAEVGTDAFADPRRFHALLADVLAEQGGPLRPQLDLLVLTVRAASASAPQPTGSPEWRRCVVRALVTDGTPPREAQWAVQAIGAAFGSADLVAWPVEPERPEVTDPAPIELSSVELFDVPGDDEQHLPAAGGALAVIEAAGRPVPVAVSAAARRPSVPSTRPPRRRRGTGPRRHQLITVATASLGAGLTIGAGLALARTPEPIASPPSTVVVERFVERPTVDRIGITDQIDTTTSTDASTTTEANPPPSSDPTTTSIEVTTSVPDPSTSVAPPPGSSTTTAPPDTTIPVVEPPGEPPPQLGRVTIPTSDGRTSYTLTLGALPNRLVRLSVTAAAANGRAADVTLLANGKAIGVAKQLTGSPSEVRWFIKPEAFVVGLNHLTLSIKGTKITFHGPLVLRQQ